MFEPKLIYWLCNIEGFGAVKGFRLLKDLTDVSDLNEEKLMNISWITLRDQNVLRDALRERNRIWEEYEKLSEKQIQFITFDSPEYPCRLLHLNDKPLGLFVKGRLPAQNRPLTAIVGARACSHYGRETAHMLGDYYGKLGIDIVSGMAYGIDAAGQWGAVHGGGRSYAVLAGGVDICYPREHMELYLKLQECGGVISESLPGTQGRPWLFPMRNRIISGMAQAVIVVEARKKSGSLITVDQALEQGKEVYAVPGRLNDPLSAGCHELIRNGASILTHPKTLVQDLGLQEPDLLPDYKISLLLKEVLKHPIQALIIQALSGDLLHVEELLRETKMPVGQLMENLLELELSGIIEQPVHHYYRVCG